MLKFTSILLTFSMALPGLSSADPFAKASLSRPELFRAQVQAIDARFGVQTLVLAPAPKRTLGTADLVADGSHAENLAYHGRYKGRYLELARQAAQRHGVPEGLFLRLIQQESAWNRNAISSAGAIGLAQLMPGTARDLRVNPHDPVSNLSGGAKYLRKMFDRFQDWRLALAAYNAGPGAVQKYGGIPPYRETRNYVRRIMGS